MGDAPTKDDSSLEAMLPAIPNPSSGAKSLQMGEIAAETVEPTHFTSNAEIKSPEPQHARHDSVISDGALPAASPKAAAAIRAPLKGKPLNLGSSILKTPSVAAGSESSASPPPHSSPTFGSSILKTPSSSSASSKHVSKTSAPAAGSTWLTRYEGELCPVVICDGTTAPPKFIETRHNASHLPAILLGKRIYVWIIPNNLKPFIRDNDYLYECKKFDTDDVMPTDSKADANEKLRQRAFRTDALLGADHQFWNNAIENERAARKQREKMGPKKRRHAESGGGERSFSSRKRPRDSIEMRRSSYEFRKRPGKRVFELESSSDEELDVDEGIFVANETKGESFERTCEEEEEEVDKLQESFLANHRQDFLDKKGLCTIYVSATPSKTSFRVPNSALGRCMLLTGLVKKADPNPTPTDDTYIKLYETVEIAPEDFQVVATFLNNGSIRPHVIKGRHGEPVLEGVKTAKNADATAERLARAYHTASRLHFGALQQHCTDKLRHLRTVSPGALVMATAYFSNTQGHGCAAEAEMEEWLVDHISRTFLDIVEQEGAPFARMLRQNIHLRMNVLDRVAGIEREPEEPEDGEEDGESEEEWAWDV